MQLSTTSSAVITENVVKCNARLHHAMLMWKHPT